MQCYSFTKDKDTCFLLLANVLSSVNVTNQTYTLMEQVCCPEWGSWMTSAAIATCTCTGVVHNFHNPRGLLLRFWCIIWGSIVFDGPSVLRMPETIQLLQATPTYLVTCHVTQLLTCLMYQMTAFWELVVFKKTDREHKNSDCRRCGPADGATWDPKRGTWEQCPDTDLPELWKQYFHDVPAT